MGDAERFIKSLYSSADLNGSGIMMDVNAVYGQFCPSFLQEWSESIYFHAFLKKLAKEKIPYELDGSLPLKIASASIV